MASFSSAPQKNPNMQLLKSFPPFPPLLNLSKAQQIGNAEYIPELEIEEQRRIYKSHVLLPFTLAGKPHAMLGHMADLSSNQENLKHHFPTYDRYNKPIGNRRKPISLDEVHDDENPHSDGQGYAYVEKPLVLDFFDRNSRIFRSPPLLKDPQDYLARLTKVEKKKAPF